MHLVFMYFINSYKEICIFLFFSEENKVCFDCFITFMSSLSIRVYHENTYTLLKPHVTLRFCKSSTLLTQNGEKDKAAGYSLIIIMFRPLTPFPKALTFRNKMCVSAKR